jgi:uncharacterized protein (TIGR03435 family)
MTRHIAGASAAAAIAFVTASAAGLQQETPDGGRLAFEAATVKPSAFNDGPNRVTQPSPNRLSIPGMTLRSLVYAAYGGGGYNTAMRVTGGPDWTNTTVFAVEGVAPGPATPRQLRLMLQTLLEERFALKLRHATEDVPMGGVLSLVVDRSDGTLGPKVKPWDGTCPAVMPALVFPAPRRPLQRIGDKFVAGPPSDEDDPDMPYCPTGYRVGGIRADGVTMSTVASLLSLPPARALLGRFTRDRTGLTGRYTLELDFLFTAAPPAGPPAPTDFAGPSLSTAIREQWGLRLVPGAGELKVIVIENAQPPSN